MGPAYAMAARCRPLALQSFVRPQPLKLPEARSASQAAVIRTLRRPALRPAGRPRQCTPMAALPSFLEKAGHVLQDVTFYVLSSVVEGTQFLYSKAAPAVEKAANKLDLNHFVIQGYQPLVDTVNALEPDMMQLSDAELADKTAEFKARLAAGQDLEMLQAEAFAVVRETARRVLGMRHFDVQIIGGAVLCSGAVAEMATGEGKTLVATLPAYLHALTGEGVHVVTVNDYLAARDAEWMGQIFTFLGLKVGLILREDSEANARRAAYEADITYVTNNELGFDYLRDHTTKSSKNLRQKRKSGDVFSFAIIDEVDKVLIDDARDPLLISQVESGGVIAQKYQLVAEVAAELKPDEDYKVDYRNKTVKLVDSGEDQQGDFSEGLGLAGVQRAEFLLKDELQGAGLWDGSATYAEPLLTALQAKEIYKKDRDYIVGKDGEVILIDQATGRPMPNKRFQGSLHQALEAKEKVRVIGESKTIAETTAQSFFKKYRKLSGMTGTAKSEESEFQHVYKLPVVVVPPNKPRLRIDMAPQLYRSRSIKWGMVVTYITYVVREYNRPVLVGTTSVEDSEELQKELIRYTEDSVPHAILNAKPENAAKEAEIIAQAGRAGAVTISTNMAGRGTDIMLGGNPESLAASLVARRVLPELCPEAAEERFAEVRGNLLQTLVQGIPLSARSQALLARACIMARKEQGLPTRILTSPEDPSSTASSMNVTEGSSSTASSMNLTEDSSSTASTASSTNITEASKGADPVVAVVAKSIEISSADSSKPGHDRQAVTPKEAEALLAWAAEEAQCRARRQRPRIADSSFRGVLADTMEAVLQDCRLNCEQERRTVAEAGGLFVIGTNLHPSRRIDNQLRGRAGRQGDPGTTLFILSLEDDLFLPFGDMAKTIMEYFPYLTEEGVFDDALQNGTLLGWLLDVQNQEERRNYNHRKSVLDYDEIVEVQREHMYKEREMILLESEGLLRKRVHRYMQDCVDKIVESHCPPNKRWQQWDLEGLAKECWELAGKSPTIEQKVAKSASELQSLLQAGRKGILPKPPASTRAYVEAQIRLQAIVNKSAKLSREVNLVRAYMGETLIHFYERRFILYSIDGRRAARIERYLMLQALDDNWRRYAAFVSRLKQSVNARGFSQVSPLEEFKMLSATTFLKLLINMRHQYVKVVLQPQLPTLEVLLHRGLLGD